MRPFSGSRTARQDRWLTLALKPTAMLCSGSLVDVPHAQARVHPQQRLHPRHCVRASRPQVVALARQCQAQPSWRRPLFCKMASAAALTAAATASAVAAGFNAAVASPATVGGSCSGGHRRQNRRDQRGQCRIVHRTKGDVEVRQRCRRRGCGERVDGCRRDGLVAEKGEGDEPGGAGRYTQRKGGETQARGGGRARRVTDARLSQRKEHVKWQTSKRRPRPGVGQRTAPAVTCKATRDATRPHVHDS